MRDRRKMQLGDWLIWIALLVVGALLGLAVVALVGFDEPAFFLSIVFYFIPVGFLFVFTFFMFELAGPSSLDEDDASSGRETKKPKPLFLLASLPAGFAIGAIDATFGLSSAYL